MPESSACRVCVVLRSLAQVLRGLGGAPALQQEATECVLHGPACTAEAFRLEQALLRAVKEAQARLELREVHVHLGSVVEALEQPQVGVMRLLEAEARLEAMRQPQPRHRILGVVGRAQAIELLADLESARCFEPMVNGIVREIERRIESAARELVAHRIRSHR